MTYQAQNPKEERPSAYERGALLGSVPKHGQEYAPVVPVLQMPSVARGGALLGSKQKRKAPLKRGPLGFQAPQTRTTKNQLGRLEICCRVSCLKSRKGLRGHETA